MEREGFRSEWNARPPALRVFVVGVVLGVAFSASRDPSALSFPAILFTFFVVALLWKLWEGERAIWWLFVIASAGGLVAGVTAAFHDPAAWAGAAAGAFALALLLVRPTRAWVWRRAAEMYPAP